MTDIEHRLRAAMAAAAEPAPPGLLDSVRRRHQQHVLRVRVACIGAAAAVAIAGSVTARAVLAGPGGPAPAGLSPAAGSTATATIPPIPPIPRVTGHGLPGTVLENCQTATGGTLGSDWQRRSAHAGPVWFIYAKVAGTYQGGPTRPGGKVTTSAMAIAVADGHRAVVRVAPQAAGQFLFLGDFKNTGAYSMRDGQPGLTLAGCPRGPAGTHIPARYAPGLTLFWQGYVTDLTGCLPLQVRALPGGHTIPVTLRLGRRGCAS
ncbi:MAG TPA: hypothetical protein VH637_15775 [Streptosporangiaceae bacterium]|jgi:hypothetical protein